MTAPPTPSALVNTPAAILAVAPCVTPKAPTVLRSTVPPFPALTSPANVTAPASTMEMDPPPVVLNVPPASVPPPSWAMVLP